MGGEKINLSEIISQVVDKNYNSKYRNICIDAMMEFGKQLLEMASENAVVTHDIFSQEYMVDKDSIINTINNVEINKN